jgi:hypothetical protein
MNVPQNESIFEKPLSDGQLANPANQLLKMLGQ